MPTMPIASAQGETPRLLRVESDEVFSSAEMEVSCKDKGKKTNLSTGRKRINKRRTRFFGKVAVRATNHLFDMTDEEIDNTWYSRQDMSSIKSELVNDMRKIISGRPLTNNGGGDNNVTLRGLEDCMKIKESGGKSKRNSKKDAIYAVLDLQDEQYLSGEFDPEALRAVYASESEEFTNEAQVLGKIDEVEASLIHEVYTKNNIKKETI